MKYEVKPDSELFRKLNELQDKLDKTTNQIRDFLLAEGFTGKYGTDGSMYLTCCCAIDIDGEKPDGWKSVGGDGSHLYMPKATNKAMLKKIAALPSMKVEELNSLLDFHFAVGSDLKIYYRPSVQFNDGRIAVLIGDSYPNYKPVADMVELSEKDYADYFPEKD